MAPLSVFFPSAAALLTDHRPHGEGLIAWNFLSELASRGHEIVACAREVDIRGPRPFEVIDVGRASSLESIEPLLYARRVRGIFDEIGGAGRFDVVHWMFPPGDEEILFDAPRGVPYVIGPQAPSWPGIPPAGGPGAAVRLLLRPAFRSARRRAWSSAAAVLLSTPPARETVPPFATAPIHIVPFGVNPHAFDVAPTPDQPTIGFIGRLEEQKGLRDLIDAFEQVRGQLPEARLLVAGDGPLRSALEAQTGAIELLGNIPHEEVSEVLGRCSLLCVPSHGEPYGMTILEAMACARPTVAYAWGGPQYLVDHGRGGFLASRESGPAGLAAAMVELLTDRARLEAMGRYNRGRALEQFSWSSVARLAEKIYLSTTAPERQDERALIA